MGGYIFDTNIFIKSKNEMPHDLWPTFWMKLSDLMRSGQISSSIKVKEEIDRGKDELTLWMKNNASESFYHPVDTNVLKKYSDAQNWARAKNFSPNALNEFADVADAYIVATAAVKGYTLVTNEISAPNSVKRVKIPDVCAALGVKYCDLNTVLRELGVTI